LTKQLIKKYKEELKKEFQMWFADMVAKKLSNKKDNDEIQTSIIKPLHAKWLIKCHETLERDHEFITRAFKAVGIPC
jgi:predicted amidophosphoribosyltransferase